MRTLCDDFEKSLKSRFRVIETIDLIDYDNQLDVLLEKLTILKKDKFEPDEKIVFLHFDTEFYLYKNIPGLLLTNLHKILSAIDIPLQSTLLITNHYGLNEKLTQARVNFTTEETNMPCIFTNFQKLLINNTKSINNYNLNTEQIEKQFVCLNGQERFHRRALVSLFEYYKLEESGLISYAPDPR